MNRLINFLTWLVTMIFKYKLRSPGLLFARTLAGFGFCGMASQAVSISFEYQGWFGIGAQFGQSPPMLVSIAVLAIGILIGIWCIRKIPKTLTCLLYIQGMPGMKEVVPVKDLPAYMQWGTVDPIKIHLEQNNFPESQFSEIEQIPRRLKERIESHHKSPEYVVFAGLAPVPLLYLAGLRCGSRRDIHYMDYDRSKPEWHSLEKPDDGERITISAPEKLESEISLLLSFSAPINVTQLPETHRNCIVSCDLADGPRPDALDSKDKLEAVLKEILTFIRNSRAQVDVIHLYMAVSASTAFRLGTLHQPNMYPEIRVYQFNASANAYTWGVKISGEKAEYFGAISAKPNQDFAFRLGNAITKALQGRASGQGDTLSRQWDETKRSFGNTSAIKRKKIGGQNN